MSLTRSFLNGMGLSADQVSAIIEAHTDTVDALKAQRDEYKADAEKAGKIQAELDEANKKLGNVDDSWKEKYEAEHKAFEDYKTEQAEATTTRTKTEAYKSALKQAGVSEKAIDLIIDGSKAKDAIKALELDEAGQIKGIEELTESFKTEYSGFITTSSTLGANVQKAPIVSASDGKMSKDEIMQIKDASARQKAIAENPEAFGL